MTVQRSHKLWGGMHQGNGFFPGSDAHSRPRRSSHHPFLLVRRQAISSLAVTKDEKRGFTIWTRPSNLRLRIRACDYLSGAPRFLPYRERSLTTLGTDITPVPSLAGECSSKRKMPRLAESAVEMLARVSPFYSVLTQSCPQCLSVDAK